METLKNVARARDFIDAILKSTLCFFLFSDDGRLLPWLRSSPRWNDEQPAALERRCK